MTTATPCVSPEKIVTFEHAESTETYEEATNVCGGSANILFHVNCYALLRFQFPLQVQVGNFNAASSTKQPHAMVVDHRLKVLLVRGNPESAKVGCQQESTALLLEWVSECGHAAEELVCSGISADFVTCAVKKQ